VVDDAKVVAPVPEYVYVTAEISSLSTRVPELMDFVWFSVCPTMNDGLEAVIVIALATGVIETDVVVDAVR
jgi:hypothetical protein